MRWVLRGRCPFWERDRPGRLPYAKTRNDEWRIDIIFNSAFRIPHSALGRRATRAPSGVFLLFFFLTLQTQNVCATPSPHFPAATVVEGQVVPSLHGRTIANLRVFAFIGKTFTPIPFQIDERDRRERWVLESDTHPNPDNPLGLFDANNVIVFMNRDLGERGSPARTVSEAALWIEVRVGDETHPIGFAYIGVFPTSPEVQSPPPSVRCETERDRVYAERYALAFGAPLPTHLAFVEKLGDFGTNAIAGVRAVGEVRLLGGLFALHRSEQDMRMEGVTYRAGPVRVIRRARYWIPLPLGFRAQGRFDLLFYRDFVEGTTTVKIKIPPRLVLGDGELKAYFDFLHLPDARPILEDKHQGNLTNGYHTNNEQVLSEGPTRWAALLRPDGKVVLLVVRLEGALQQLEQQLYFDNPPDGQGNDGGQTRFGFLFSHLNRLTTGTHRLSVFAMVLDSADPEDIHRAVDAFLTPPIVSVAVVQP